MSTFQDEVMARATNERGQVIELAVVDGTYIVSVTHEDGGPITSVESADYAQATLDFASKCAANEHGLTPEQVRWAQQHDWHLISVALANGRYSVTVEARTVDAHTGKCSRHYQTFTDYKALRAWANY